MRINNNIMAMNAHRQLGVNQNSAAKSMERLSSGLRINRAADDAAGLAISEKMRGQVRGLKQASRNAQDSISLIQTAEGSLNETHAILQRMRELATQASNDTYTAVDRSEIQKEMNELIDEIDRIAANTQFNTQNLLDGSFVGKKFHIGANESQDITLNISAMGSGAASGQAGKTIGGEGLYTEGTATVQGVENQTVLKDGEENIVAVKIGDDWYAPDAVELGSAAPGVTAKEGVSTVTVETGQVISGELVTQGTAEVEGIAGQTVLKDGSDAVVAVKVGEDWFAPTNVEASGAAPAGLVAKDADDKITVGTGQVVGGELVTQGTAEIEGIAGQTVLKTADDTIKAVQVGGEWYAPTNVETTGGAPAQLVLEGSPSPLTIATNGLVLNDELVTQHTEDYSGVAGQTVLKDGDDAIVAVKVGDDWYAPADVKEDAGAIVLEGTPTALDVATDGMVLNDELVTQGTAEVAGIADQTVLKEGETVVAVKIGDDWYAPSDVKSDGGTPATGLVPTDSSVKINVESGQVIGGELVAQSTAEVAGIADQTVLKDGNNDVVAVKIGDDWYAPSNVESDGGTSAQLVAKDTNDKIIVESGQVINGELVTQGTAEVAGIADQTVLKDGSDDVVAVKVGDDWYSPGDVEADGGSANGLVAKDGAERLIVADAPQDPAANGGLGVGSLKVAGVTKESDGGIMTQDGATKAITTIDNAIELVSAERSKLGAYQNRLEHTISNLGTAAENLQAAESRIRDVDMAAEMMDFTRTNILNQAATAMLAQGNQAPSAVLQLLG